MRRRTFACLTAVFAYLLAGRLSAAEPRLLLRQPTLSRESIAFVFAGDLWSVARSGGEARRLTASAGIESEPVFSPDGSTIAFSGEYDGNVDLYTIPAGGGAPVRLTFHPGVDRAVGWTPDGARILFRSIRDNGNGDDRLWTLPRAGGWPERMSLPEAYVGSYSPDGKRFAYMPHERFQMAWKHYRGGESTFIWIVDLATLDVTPIPRLHTNDSYPAWASDGRIYFISDRDGVVTLFRHQPGTNAVERVFTNDGLDLKNLQAGPGALVFERFGEIGLYDLATGRVDFPAIHVASDLEWTRPRYVKAGDDVTAAAISPSGARAVFSIRGEIVTVPGEKGDARNLTRSSGAADREPAWSADGKSLAWISDASGDTALAIGDADGLKPPRILPPPTPRFLYQPVWSPDGKKIALHDQELGLWIVDVASGAWTKVADDTFSEVFRTFDPAWSPDSRFLAYTLREKTHLHAVHVYDLEAKRATRLTDALADARYPVFDASGKYLWLTASTDFGPTSAWLDMTGVEHPATRSLWLAVLQASEPSPFPPESDEEKGESASSEDDAAKKEKAKDEKKAAETTEKKDEKPARTTIDFDGIADRIVAVPGIETTAFQRLAPGKKGELILLEMPTILPADTEDLGAGKLSRYSLEERKLTELADDVSFVDVSRDGEKLLYRKDESWAIAGTGEEIEEGKGELALDKVEIRIDPREEWRQMFREAWRRQRDFFYDPGYHGLDLAAAEAKYAPWVDGLAHRIDLSYLLSEMLGNLTVGHMYIYGGDLPKPPKVKGGLLGADWEIDRGRYRIARVLTGESWNPALEAPLARPGVRARKGEYLISVEGHEVTAAASIYAAFEATAGQSTRIRLAPDPSGKDGRDVTVVPVATENQLRYRVWVEDNRRRAAELSQGKVGYVHLPNTAGDGYESFNRYFFPQIDHPALLVDERNNGGGLVADYVVEVLGRKQLWGLTSRSGTDFTSPLGAHFGPKAMLINRHAGSGGDALPWMFRKLAVGPLVGTRTWGGLVGIWDYPELVDGGMVTAPRGALYTTDGKWGVENQGVAPDFEIEITPRDFAAGRDPQLEKGVALLLDALAKAAPVTPRHPPYPNYQTNPWRSEAQP